MKRLQRQRFGRVPASLVRIRHTLRLGLLNEHRALPLLLNNHRCGLSNRLSLNQHRSGGGGLCQNNTAGRGPQGGRLRQGRSSENDGSSRPLIRQDNVSTGRPIYRPEHVPSALAFLHECQTGVVLCDKCEMLLSRCLMLNPNLADGVSSRHPSGPGRLRVALSGRTVRPVRVVVNVDNLGLGCSCCSLIALSRRTV